MAISREDAKSIIIPEIGIFAKVKLNSIDSRVNAAKRVKIVNGKNSYSQRGDRDMKIDKWNKKFKGIKWA